MSDLDELLAPPSDAAVAQAVVDYAAAVAGAYGPRLVGMFLFGSRARGDHRPDSDVDLAIVVADFEASVLAEKMRLVDLGFDALTESGVMMQPWAFTNAQWVGNAPDDRFADLLQAARRDAIPIPVNS